MTHPLTIPFGPLSIHLEIHYLPAIRSLREASTGLPVEPDTEEEFEIMSATINGEDVWDDLDAIVDWDKVAKVARKAI